MRHDGGIKQRRGFQRILVSEICAEQQLSFFRHARARGQGGSDPVEALPEKLIDFYMTPAKLGLHLLQQRAPFAFGKSHDLRAKIHRAPVVRLEEWTE